jgi:hypothetical protein
MSLEVDGTWKAGVWAATAWADGVWREGEQEEPEIVGGGAAFLAFSWPWLTWDVS